MFRQLMCGLIGLLLAVGSLFGQRMPTYVSPDSAASIGLEAVWMGQLQVDVSRGGLRGLHLRASRKQTYAVVEVRYDGGVIRYSERDFSRQLGGVIGLDHATRLAEYRFRELEQLGRKPEMEVKRVSDITLYATSTRGGVDAFDAETGRTLWSTQIGNRNYPTGEPAANDEFVVAVNGSSLYTLDHQTGRVLHQQRLATTAGAGPALNDEWVFVPIHNGRIEGYSLVDFERRPWFYQSDGRTLVQPTVTPNMVSWGTDKGFLYLADPVEPAIRFRVRTDESIQAPTSFLEPHYLFAVSVDGYVYAVHERKGQLLWTFSAGEPISQRPISFDNSLFIATDRGTLVSLDPETGEQRWRTSGTRRILAGSGDRLYTLSEGGRLVVVNREDGAKLAGISLQSFSMPFVNVVTDRIYLASESGALQCLREIDRGIPIVRIPKGAPAEDTKDVADQAADSPADQADTTDTGGDVGDIFDFGGGDADPGADDALDDGLDEGAMPDDAADDALDESVEDPFNLDDL